MTDEQFEQPRTPIGDDGRPAPSEQGFSSAEKLLGAYAGYKAPLITGIAAREMARHETDPVRRRQLDNLSRSSCLWWAVGAAVGLFFLVVVMVSFNSMGDGPGGAGGGPHGGCRGGADTTAYEDITYASDDGVHWTGTYPCFDGGTTTVPVPRDEVPGETP